MTHEAPSMRAPTSPAHDVFEVMFQAADMWNSLWQPMLKNYGRWQLEMSQLAAKQARANMALVQKVAQCRAPEHMVEAYKEFWHDTAGFYGDASRNIATALVRSAPHAAVLQLPVSKHPVHDTLRLIDTPSDGKTDYERKVA